MVRYESCGCCRVFLNPVGRHLEYLNCKKRKQLEAEKKARVDSHEDSSDDEQKQETGAALDECDCPRRPYHTASCKEHPAAAQKADDEQDPSDDDDDDDEESSDEDEDSDDKGLVVDHKCRCRPTLHPGTAAKLHAECHRRYLEAKQRALQKRREERLEKRRAERREARRRNRKQS